MNPYSRSLDLPRQRVRRRRRRARPASWWSRWGSPALGGVLIALTLWMILAASPPPGPHYEPPPRVEAP